MIASNVVVKGLFCDGADAAATKGWFCDIVDGWREIVYFIMRVQRVITFTVER